MKVRVGENRLSQMEIACIPEVEQTVRCPALPLDTDLGVLL